MELFVKAKWLPGLLLLSALRLAGPQSPHSVLNRAAHGRGRGICPEEGIASRNCVLS